MRLGKLLIEQTHRLAMSHFSPCVMKSTQQHLLDHLSNKHACKPIFVHCQIQVHLNLFVEKYGIYCTQSSSFIYKGKGKCYLIYWYICRINSRKHKSILHSLKSYFLQISQKIRCDNDIRLVCNALAHITII